MATNSIEKKGTLKRSNIVTELTEYSKIKPPFEQDVKVVFGDYNALDEPIPSLGLTRKARRGDTFIDKYFGVWTYNPIRNIRNHFKGGRFTFDAGITEPQPGDVIHGASSAAQCTVQSVVVISGSWTAHNATGTIYFETLSGFFIDNEDIKNVSNGTILTVVDSPVYVVEIILSIWSDLANINSGDTLTGQTSGCTFTLTADAIDVTIPMDSSGNPGMDMPRALIECKSTNQTAFASENELLTMSSTLSGTVTYKNATFRPLSDIYDIYGEPFYYILKIDDTSTPVNVGSVYSHGGYNFEIAQVADNILYAFYLNPDGVTWGITGETAGTEFTLVSGIGPETIRLSDDFTGTPDNTYSYQSNFFNAHYLFNHITTVKIDYSMFFPGCAVVIKLRNYTNSQFESIITSFGTELTTNQKTFFRISVSEDAVSWNIVADSKIQDLSSDAQTHLLFHPKPGTNYKYLKIENTGSDFSSNSPSDDISIKARDLCFTKTEIDDGEESDKAWEQIRPQKYFNNYVVPADVAAVPTNPRVFTVNVPLEGYYKVDAFLAIIDLILAGDTAACITSDIDILEVKGSGENLKLIDSSGYQAGGVGVIQSWRRGSMQGSAEVYVNSSKQITLQFTRNNGSYSKISQGYICYEYLGKFRPGSQTE